jgi:hypothetical protein
MKVLHFNVFTSCPIDELHQWFLGLYDEHIVPAIAYRYTKVLQRPDLVTVDKNVTSHPFGRPQPRASVAKIEQIRRASRSDSAWSAWETKKARKRAAEEM